MSLNGWIQQLTISSKHPKRNAATVLLAAQRSNRLETLSQKSRRTIFLAPFCRLCRAVREGRSVHGMNASKLYVQARIQPVSCTPFGHITRFHHTLQWYPHSMCVTLTGSISDHSLHGRRCQPCHYAAYYQCRSTTITVQQPASSKSNIQI